MGSDWIHWTFTLATSAALVYMAPDFSYEAQIMMLVMSFTHFLLYPVIWYFPDQYCKYIAGSRGVEVYRDAVFLQKNAIGALGLYFWFDKDQFVQTWLDKTVQCVIATLFIALGVHLNAMVYEKIGKDGVYYGYKLGKRVPWVTDYPFNTFRHPQYCGACFIYFGCAYLVGGGFTPDGIHTCIFQAWGYALSGIMEESSDNHEEAEVKSAPILKINRSSSSLSSKISA